VQSSIWRFLPLAAVLLAVSFVIWDMGLMARSTQIQRRLDNYVLQLGDLGRLGADLNRLAVVHRKDLQTGSSEWSAEYRSVRSLVDSQYVRSGNSPLSLGMGKRLERDLAACDSLHALVRAERGNTAQAEMADAVFGLMLQRARSHVEEAASTLRKDGLGRETGALSTQWNEAQWLLGLASLFAVICAALVGFVARLLARSHERSELLARTGEELERRNRELQETMLSKEEKEVMLKEIHHRVKNNLQIVRSLIRFQTDKVSDPRTMELFNECVNRVGAMALVHEQTYMSKDLANINVANYLNSLVRDLVAAYNIRVKLKMDVEVQVETLGVDTLTPLGLLINEVVSNSFKHAFKGRGEGTIILHLSGIEQGGLLLRVGDDGVGLPDQGTWQKPNSLGMDLIHTLAGQLNATMELLPGPGMVYELITRPEVELRRRA
jgi:two-component sensor histidine kinase